MRLNFTEQTSFRIELLPAIAVKDFNKSWLSWKVIAVDSLRNIDVAVKQGTVEDCFENFNLRKMRIKALEEIQLACGKSLDWVSMELDEHMTETAQNLMHEEIDEEF